MDRKSSIHSALDMQSFALLFDFSAMKVGVYKIIGGWRENECENVLTYSTMALTALQNSCEEQQSETA
jgi:hypothetical protein